MSNPQKRPISIKESVSTDRTPRVVENPDGSFKKYPSWRFAIADMEHEDWSVLDPHEDVLTDESYPGGSRIVHTFSKSIDRALLDGLTARENMTWGALLTQNGGRKGGTNSHNIPIYELDKKAQRRAKELELDADELLSLRLTGTQRVFGILEEGVLNVVWFDRDHKICPPTPR